MAALSVGPMIKFSAGKTYSEVGDHGIRAVLLIERINEERLVLDAVLDGGRNLVEDFFGGIDEDLVQVLLLPNPVQESVERLDTRQLTL